MKQPSGKNTEQQVLAALRDVVELSGRGSAQKISSTTVPFKDLEDFDSLAAVSVAAVLQDEIQRLHPKIDLAKLGLLFAADNDTKMLSVKETAALIDKFIANKGKMP